MTDEQKLAKLYRFLARIYSGGYTELSHDKVRGEYLFFKKRARELMHELFPEEVEPTNQPLDGAKSLDDNF